MKRILFFALLSAVALNVACRPEAAGNGSSGKNINVTQTDNINGTANTTPTPTLGILRNNNEKTVKVSITPLANNPQFKCQIRVTSGDHIVLKKGKGKVIWEIENDCADASDVPIVITGFVSTNNPNDKTPFGTDADCDPNKIILDPVANGDTGRVVSKTAKGTLNATYKYAIKATPAAADLDPEVEISN